MLKKMAMILLSSMPMLAVWGETIDPLRRLFYFEDEKTQLRSWLTYEWYDVHWKGTSVNSTGVGTIGYNKTFTLALLIKESHMAVNDWGLLSKTKINTSSETFDGTDWQNAKFAYKQDQEIANDGKFKYFYTFTSDNIKDTSGSNFYSYPWLRWYRFNLSFDANGGEAISSRSDIPYKVSTGSKDSNGYLTYKENEVSLPTPVRTGYTFNGWKLSGKDTLLNGTVKSSVFGVDSDGKNITLTAQWTVNTYKVTFDATGGSISTGSIYVTYGSDYGEMPEPSRNGYRFGGWYTEPDDTGVKVMADTEVTITSAQTLYAHWIELYTVSFQSEGGTEYATYSVLYGENVTPPSIDVPVGKRLVGWEYGDRLYAPKERITVYYSMELIAQFEMLHTEVHSLSCEPVDGGSVALSPDGGMYGDYGREVTLTATPSVSHNFVRWSDGSTDPNHKVRIVCDTNFVAHFEKKWFTVDFYDADGTTPLTDAQRIEYGDPAVAPSAPQRVGLTFTGWNPSDFGSVVSNMSIVAQYGTNSYTVVYDPNGGTGSMDEDVFMYFTEYSLQSNTFRRVASEFLGWASNPNAATNEVEYENCATVSNLTSVADGTNTLYAVWQSLISDYSKAADCTNLVLECINTNKAQWLIDYGYGYQGTSSVYAVDTDSFEMSALLDGMGTLTFRLKLQTASENQNEFRFLTEGSIVPITEILNLHKNQKEQNGDWIFCVFNKGDVDSRRYRWCFQGNIDTDKVYIDQVRWYPDRLVSVDAGSGNFLPSGREVNAITESVLSNWDEILPSGITNVQIDAKGSEFSPSSSVTNAVSILNLGYTPEYTVNGSTAELTFTNAPTLAVNAFEVEGSTVATLGASVTNTSWGLPDYSNGVDKVLTVWGTPTLTSDWSRVEAECDLSRYVSEGIALFNFDAGTNRFFKVKAD